MREPAVETWISEEQLSRIEYASYWTDETRERGKAFDVSHGDFAPMDKHLRESGLRDDLFECLSVLRNRHGWSPRGSGVDLAAGNLWAAPLLVGPEVDRLYCVEISRHRLLQLGPQVIARYGIPPERLVLALGSFYDLKLPDASQDFALLSQALHHADNPVDLLREVRRVLRPGGCAIVIGEHRIAIVHVIRYYVKGVAAKALPARAHARLFSRMPSELRLRPRGEAILPHDPTMGDHFYLDWEYRRMFSETGFDYIPVRRRGALYRGFVLRATDQLGTRKSRAT